MLRKVCVDECPFTLCDGLVCRLSVGGRVRIVVPADEYLCKDVITLHHMTSLAGHL